MNRDDHLIKVENLTKHFPVMRGAIFRRQSGVIRAVDKVSFTVRIGETLGLVGESGCGKSTTGRTILQLYRPTSGKVLYRDTNLTGVKGEELRHIRRNLQIIFQDPYASLNRRFTVGKIIADPLEVHKIGSSRERRERVGELLKLVGLNPDAYNRYPHEFSGGQRQRIGIARALALQPEFIVCDEPISSLDVSIQAQIVNLLKELQTQFGLTYLFIAHDISMVRYISDRIAVMYLGKIVELTDREKLFDQPLHPYTQALLMAVPIPNPSKERKRKEKRIILKGEVPSPAHPPNGCRFNTRCPLVIDICRVEEPEWREVVSGHWVACHLVDANQVVGASSTG